MREGTPVVLLVDDEPRILSALRRSLRREGYEILQAESTEAALALLDAHPVDLVVTDQKMPGGSGLAFLEEVAELRPRVARLVLTGWPEEIPTAERERLGIAAIVPKPWDDAALKAEIRRHLPDRAPGD